MHCFLGSWFADEFCLLVVMTCVDPYDAADREVHEAVLSESGD